MLNAGCGISRRDKTEEPEAFDIEPRILKPNLSDDRLPDADVVRLEKQLKRKEKCRGAERLYKIGVSQKLEVEQRLLKMVGGASPILPMRESLEAKEELLRRISTRRLVILPRNSWKQ